MRIFKLPTFLLPDNRKLESQLEVFRRALEAGGLKLDMVPFLDGILKEGVVLGAGAEATIYHGLGRVPRGWLVTRALVAAVALHEHSRDDTKIVLSSANAGTADIWIY